MLRNRQVHEPHEGCFTRWRTSVCNRVGRSGGRSILWGADGFGEQSPEPAKRARGGPEKSGFKAFVADPGGANPMGGASGCRIKTPRGRKALSGGMSPVTGSRQAGLAPSGGRDTAGCNGMWVRFRSKGRQGLLRGETSEGWIPWAPPVRNKTGTGFEGVSRQEGSQTLKTERSGQALARDQWTPDASSAVGSKSPREELAVAAVG